MSDVIFEEDQDTVVRPVTVNSQQSAIVKLVFKLGLAKTQKGAERVLVGTIIVCVVLAIIITFFGGGLRVLGL